MKRICIRLVLKVVVEEYDLEDDFIDDNEEKPAKKSERRIGLIFV